MNQGGPPRMGGPSGGIMPPHHPGAGPPNMGHPSAGNMPPHHPGFPAGHPLNLPPVGPEEPKSDTLQERLKRLNDAEQKLNEAMIGATGYMSEVSTDRLTSIRKLEPTRAKFIDNIRAVEKELREQLELLSQVSVGSTHEGSVYEPKQRQMMAEDRFVGIESQLKSVAQSIPPSDSHF